jgi:hypothetical protein
MAPALIAIVAAVLFLIGIIVGVILMVSMAIRREDRLGTLTARPPSRLLGGARVVTRGRITRW